MIKDLTEEEFKPEVKITKAKFTARTEQIFPKSSSYLDAIQAVCDEFDVDYEAAGKYLTPTMKEKVMQEAQERRLLKTQYISNTATLPV